MDPLLVSVKEACRVLSCGSTLVFEMLGDGRLDRVRIGRKTCVTMISINRLIARGADKESPYFTVR